MQDKPGNCNLWNEFLDLIRKILTIPRLVFLVTTVTLIYFTILLLPGLKWRMEGKLLPSLTQTKVYELNSETEHKKLHTYIDGRLTSENEINTTYKDRNIMLWYVPPRYVNNTPNLEPIKACPERNCFTTTNKKYMKDAAAVFFNVQIMSIPQPPSRPDPKQIWILHDTEPLEDFYTPWIRNNVFRKPQWRHLFNWTMLYRNDSDISAAYGLVRKKTPNELFTRDLDLLVKNKTKNIAWLVSMCNNQGKRMEYVKLLQKYIKVDIYGACGTNWPRSKDAEFHQMINSTYKFYLAFESAFCEDYITEKFYRNYNGDYILVARGGGNYTKYIPAGTFIDTRDFNTTKDLADHLHYLNKNHEAYMEILRKKDLYISMYERLDTVVNNNIVFIHYQYETPALCEICYRINNLQIYSKTIPRVDEWFDKKLCYPPSDLK
ncbi:hypothetical protein SNE40_017784 [Patella caerulea]|uniref:Fucosyltransferase n=2 Tax=Patella caerulea TaxID=87958 RepID=A0AAN8PEQ0_PATCE